MTSGQRVAKAREQPLAKRQQPRRLARALGDGDLDGAPEADDQRHRQRARPQPALVSAAVEQRLDAHARPARRTHSAPTPFGP